MLSFYLHLAFKSRPSMLNAMVGAQRSTGSLLWPLPYVYSSSTACSAYSKWALGPSMWLFGVRANAILLELQVVS